MLIFPIPGLPHNPSGVLQGRVLYKLHTPVSRINVLKDCLRLPFAFAKTTKNQRQWNNNCFHWQECKSDAKEGQDGLLKAKEANRANEARGNFFRLRFISAHRYIRYIYSNILSEKYLKLWSFWFVFSMLSIWIIVDIVIIVSGGSFDLSTATATDYWGRTGNCPRWHFPSFDDFVMSITFMMMINNYMAVTINQHAFDLSRIPTEQ